MGKKIEFTQEELRTLCSACMSYGNTLLDIIKKIENCDKAVDLLNDVAGDSFKLVQKITEYMEE